MYLPRYVPGSGDDDPLAGGALDREGPAVDFRADALGRESAFDLWLRYQGDDIVCETCATSAYSGTVHFAP